MSELRENQDVIVLDCYEGAYGPTIRIDTHAATALDKIRDLFLQLAESKKQSMNFIEIDSVKATGVSQFILKLVPEGQEPQKKLELLENLPSGAVFCWSMSAYAWKRCAGLLDGLLEANCPAHQYLTEEGVDDAIVELAFME